MSEHRYKRLVSSIAAQAIWCAQSIDALPKVAAGGTPTADMQRNRREILREIREGLEVQRDLVGQLLTLVQPEEGTP